MNQCNMIGKIHSFQSLGTLDGPGVRFVVFTQGCNLRCGCCHNPDTWDMNNAKEIDVDEIIKKVIRYKEYFGTQGGITVSGGEPLLQPNFVRELFIKAHEENINTCLDTSGSILNDDVKELLEHTDYVLLDLKYTSNELYNKYVGCSLNNVLDFLKYLNEINKHTIIRQVIIPSLNDSKEDILKLKEITKEYKCIKKIELLPFKKICEVKYKNMNLDFKFKDFDTPSKEKMDELNNLL